MKTCLTLALVLVAALAIAQEGSVRESHHQIGPDGVVCIKDVESGGAGQHAAMFHNTKPQVMPHPFISEHVMGGRVITRHVPVVCIKDVENLSVDAAIRELREQGDIAELVYKLISSGEVCAVKGHNWAFTPHLDGDYPEHRECRMCGKVETKEPGTWK